MGRNAMKWAAAALLVLAAGVAAYAADTDTASTSPFNVTLSETVRIAVNTQPVASTVVEADLEARYFALGSFTAQVWAITNYQVSADVDFAGTAAAALLSSGATAVRVQIVQLTDFGTTADDGTDNPTSDVTAVAPYTAIPAVPGQALWHGGNTEGGSLTYQEGTVHLWLDLDQLGDQAQNNVLTVTVNLLVTEQ